MKFNCGPTERQRRQSARDRWCVWHRWFAWFPVRVGPRDCRWLETVERRADEVYEGFFFEFTPDDFRYRAINTTTTTEGDGQHG